MVAVNAEKFDFRRPFRLAPERARALDASLGAIASAVAGWLEPRLQDGATVQARPVELLPFGEFARQLTTPCAAFLVSDAEGNPAGALHLDRALAFQVIDRFLGGAGRIVEMDRGLTPIERMVTLLLAERVLGAVVAAWRDRLPGDLAVEGFESSAEALGSSSPEAPALLVRLDVHAEGEPTSLRLCLRTEALGALMEELESPPARATAERDDRPGEREQVEQSLRGARLTLTVRLPPFRLPLGDLAALRPGAVLMTGHPHDAPLEVSVGGKPRFEGAPGKAGKSLAVRLLGPTHANPREHTHPVGRQGGLRADSRRKEGTGS